MTTSTPEKQDGLKALNDAIDAIQNKITLLGGVFNVAMTVGYIMFVIINLYIFQFYIYKSIFLNV